MTEFLTDRKTFGEKAKPLPLYSNSSGNEMSRAYGWLP